MGFQGRGESEKVRDDKLLLLFKFTIKKKGRSERSEHIQIKIHISSLPQQVRE